MKYLFLVLGFIIYIILYEVFFILYHIIYLIWNLNFNWENNSYPSYSKYKKLLENSIEFWIKL